MKTKITELFGIEHPIIKGGMHYVGLAEMAAAVSAAGGLGIITGLTQRAPADLANEPWFSVDPNDVFPEEFSTFLLGDPRVREVFMKHHSDWLWPDERMRALVESL